MHDCHRKFIQLMISKNQSIKLDWEKFMTEKYSESFSIHRKNLSINCVDNTRIRDNPSHQSTDVSYHLLSRSKSSLHRKLIVRKHNLSDQANPSSRETTLDAIDFLQEYLQNGNQEILMDLLYEIAREINFDQQKNDETYSAMNNNHSMWNANLQLSNNKEKKNKKEKYVEKEKKDDDNQTKNPKKSKEKTKKIEETTTDSDSVVTSPSVINSTHINLTSPNSSSYSPVETIGFPSLSIPVPHSAGSSTIGLMSPDPSRIHIPQQSNIAHLSQIQHQLQTDPQNPTLNKTTYPQNMSVQQQLQSLSQMARDGDEILITLSVNALTQKQQRNNYYNQPSFQTDPYSPQSWNPMMPRNLEIVAKGFARAQNEHSQPPPSNPYPQQPTMPSYNQLPFTMAHPTFAPRYPMPCYSSSGPPQIPIGPPIQPIFVPPSMMMSGGFNQPPNSTDFTPNKRNQFDHSRHRSHFNTGKCDYLCQSSLYQPDFRGRPSPGVTTNPYISNPPPSMNFSAQRSSKHKTKHSSTKNKFPTINTENTNRTYSSIY